MSKPIESVPATSIIRTDHNREKPYVLINKAILRDKRLSAKAMGLLCYLLSLPSDWRVRISELPNHFSDGEDSIRAGLKELQTKGYITINRVRGAKGRIVATEVLVYEECQKPIDNQGVCPYRDYPYMEKPDVENPTLLNTDLLNTDLTKEQQQGPSPSEEDIAKAKAAVAVLIKSERKKVANGDCDMTVYDANTDVLIQDLGRIDISNTLAATLIGGYTRERIEKALEMAKKKTNPAGWLVRALPGNWDLSEKKSQEVAPRDDVRLHQRAAEEQKQREQWATRDLEIKQLYDNPAAREERSKQLKELSKGLHRMGIATERKRY